MDADVELDLGPAPAGAGPRDGDVLLTGASGFLGAFLLAELLRATTGRVYCLVRAADQSEGRRRLAAAAARFELPVPDPDRVRVVPGGLDDVERACAGYAGGKLADRVGHVVHAAARVVFTEPYEALRADNVLGTAGLLRWMRASGVADLSLVSSLAACGQAVGAAGFQETRQQPLDPEEGGYGVTKWVVERLAERAEADGMRVRVFRPGFIVGATDTGACNGKDVLWRILAGGLAVGAHPLDDRPVQLAPVDVVARAVVGLGAEPGSVGRVYHLVDSSGLSLRGLFELLAADGLATTGLPVEQWQRKVAAAALSTEDPMLSGIALYELDRRRRDEAVATATGWRDWLDRQRLRPEVDGAALGRSIRFLARQPDYRSALTRTLTAVEAREVV